MIRRTPRSPRTYTPFPYPTLFRSTYTATIRADAGHAEAALARVREAMASVRRTVAVNVSPWGNNAKGTPYWKGGMTWVGERGPELVDLPRGSAVYPREKSVAMAASAGIGGPDATIAGGTQHVHLYLDRSEEHTSELQSLMRISYAVFCL